jgi:hypothetical protein
MKYFRDNYTRELELQARKDFESGKLLLAEIKDFGNVLFLFEQSYEKILKSVYTYCECVVYNKNFEQLIEENKGLTRRHESGSELIQTILPKLLKNYKKTVEILDEKLAKNVSENKYSVIDLVNLYGLITIPPKFEDLMKNQEVVKAVGKKMINWNNSKNLEQFVNPYEFWLDFLNQIKQEQFQIKRFFDKFDDGYQPFQSKIEKNLDNPIGFKEKIKGATMFLSFAIDLSPISLAPKYARYPVKEANFKNLKPFTKINNSNLKSGLETVSEMIEFLIKHKDDFESLILGHKRLQTRSKKWKKRENRISKR